MYNRYKQTTPAKAAFGKTYNIPGYNEYLKNKYIYAKFCSELECKTPINKFANQADYLSIKKMNLIDSKCCGSSFIDKNNLNINLITKEDLRGVNVIKNNVTGMSPTNINRSVPFLYNYTVDPNGQLFGNNICGLNNWTRYMVYNVYKKV